MIVTISPAPKVKWLSSLGLSSAMPMSTRTQAPITRIVGGRRSRRATISGTIKV